MDNNICEIITDTEKLGEICDVVDPKKEGKKLQSTIVKLKHTMKANNLVSLSAPQIGENIRVFCIKFGKDDYRSFVNPVIESIDGFTLSREKCSSLPNKEYIRPRYNSIRIMYQTPLGKFESRDIKGYSAFVFEHCMDHLDGLLLSDVGFEIDEHYDELTDDEKTQLINMYLESLDIKRKQLEKEIDETPDLKQLNNAINFMEGVRSGKITVETEELKKSDVESVLSTK